MCDGGRRPFEHTRSRFSTLTPSHATGFEHFPLPEGPQVAAWSYLTPSSANNTAKVGAKAAAAALLSVAMSREVELRHPGSARPEVQMRSAGRIGLPLTGAIENRHAAAPELSLQVLGMELQAGNQRRARSSSVSGERVGFNSFDRQYHCPDRLHALGPFAARPWAGALSCVPATEFELLGASTVLPAAAAPAADYQLVSSTALRRLSDAVSAAPGSSASRTTISVPTHTQIPIVLFFFFFFFFSNIPSANLFTWIYRCTSCLPAPQESAYEMRTAGLQTLRSNSLRPALGVLMRQTTDSLACDLSVGVYRPHGRHAISAWCPRPIAAAPRSMTHPAAYLRKETQRGRGCCARRASWVASTPCFLRGPRDSSAINSGPSEPAWTANLPRDVLQAGNRHRLGHWGTTEDVSRWNRHGPTPLVSGTMRRAI